MPHPPQLVNGVGFSREIADKHRPRGGDFEMCCAHARDLQSVFEPAALWMISRERVFLVTLQDRTREVSIGCGVEEDITLLDKAIRAEFSDLPVLKPTSQLIIQVCVVASSARPCV